MHDPDSSTRSISDAAVREATGRDWTQWFALLDEAGATEMEHAAIVAWLRDQGGLKRAWWQQSVTVAYEKARGLRAPVGQTADGTFQVGVSRTLQVSAEAGWRLLTTRPGRELWLGTLDELALAPGATFRTEEGTEGEIRSVRPGRRLRLTWRPVKAPAFSTLQLTLTPKGRARCTLSIHHERLPDAEARTAMKARWHEVLASLADMIGARDPA